MSRYQLTGIIYIHRERDRDRQTDTQTDRQTHRQRDREAGRQVDIGRQGNI